MSRFSQLEHSFRPATAVLSSLFMHRMMVSLASGVGCSRREGAGACGA